MFTSTTLLTLAAVAATASAQAGTTILVTVGKGGLVYTPNDIKAEVGTNIEFSFFPKNHTVTQSSFKDPCHPLENGFFSSFVPTADSPSGSTFTITVKDTKPIWLYCGQGNHCQTGMVAAINAPQTGNTFEAFAALAQNATASTSPPGGAVGGILKLADGSSSGSSSASASGSAAASGSTVISTTKAVTTTVTATITAVVTREGSVYTSTYPSTYGTTYTTAIPQTTVAVAAGGSSTSPSPSASSTGAAAGLAINGGMAGAILLAGLAML